MALCDVAEFSFAVMQQGCIVPIALEPPTVLQTQLAVTSTHADSAPFAANSRFIQFGADVPMRYKIAPPVSGTPVPATAADRRLDAGQIYFGGVQPGHCLSVILTT
jgi:hypothetical protein